MAIVAAASPIRAAAHGADLRFVGGVTDKEVRPLFPRQILRLRQAERHAFGYRCFGDYSDFRARKVLEMFGLQAQKDVTLLQIGAQTARFAALRTNHVQSTFVVPPLTLVARKAGLANSPIWANSGFPYRREPSSSCNPASKKIRKRFMACSAPLSKRSAYIRRTKNRRSALSRAL